MSKYCWTMKEISVLNDPWINPSGSRHILTPFKIILTFVKGVIQYISVNLQVACFHPHLSFFHFPNYLCKAFQKILESPLFYLKYTFYFCLILLVFECKICCPSAHPVQVPLIVVLTCGSADSSMWTSSYKYSLQWHPQSNLVLGHLPVKYIVIFRKIITTLRVATHCLLLAHFYSINYTLYLA